MVYDFNPTSCVYSIPLPSLGDKNHILSKIMRDPTYILQLHILIHRQYHIVSLYCTILYDMIKYYDTQYCIVLYETVFYCINVY